LTNRSEINDLQQDKIAIAKKIIKDKIESQIIRTITNRNEREQIYEANALKFIEEWDSQKNYSNTTSITLNIPVKSLNNNTILFSAQEYPRNFRKLKEKDDKITSLSMEAIEKKRKFDQANEDATVSKDELISKGLTKKEAKKIIKHIEKAEYRDEKAKEHNEAMKDRYKLYAEEIQKTIHGDTSTVRYNVDKNK